MFLFSVQPPKSKTKKKKKRKSPAEGQVTKRQLEKNITQLREELDSERKKKTDFQLEKDEIQAFWETCKKKLKETEEAVRDRCSERDKAEERHHAEISAYKLKLRHVLSENHTVIQKLKTQGFLSSSIEKQQSESEQEFLKGIRSLKTDVREKQLSTNNGINEIYLTNQLELMELSSNYDRSIREIENKHDRRMQVLRDTEENKVASEVCDLEDLMRKQTMAMRDGLRKTLTTNKEYVCDTQSKGEADKKRMRDDLAVTKKRQARVDKDKLEALQMTTTLQESLLDAKQRLSQVCRQKEKRQQANAEREMLDAVKQQLRDTTLEQELLMTEFELLKKERDELLKNQTEANLAAQQKSGMKQMLLEKKVEALTSALENEKAQVCATAKYLQDTIASKEATIKSLHDSLAQVSQKYRDLLQMPKAVPQIIRPEQQR